MTDCIRRDHTVWTTCPCQDCLKDRRRMSKRLRTGRITRTPSDAAWRKLHQWIDAGYSVKWIASAAGIPMHGLADALREHRNHGRTRNFGPQRAHDIATADIDTATEGWRTATGSMRRLQALAVNGWAGDKLGAESGISFVTLATIQRGDSKSISARHWRTIRDMYERLEDVPGESTLAANRARKKGWYPPAQWDDPDTDPEPPRTLERMRDTPLDHVAIQRRLDGDKTVKLTKQERVEALRLWLDRRPDDDMRDGPNGFVYSSIAEFERRTGITRAHRYKTAALAQKDEAA